MRGDSAGVLGWLLIVAGRFTDAIDWTPFLLYFEVGTNGLFARLDIIDDRAEMGAVGGRTSSFATSIPGRV